VSAPLNISTAAAPVLVSKSAFVALFAPSPVSHEPHVIGLGLFFKQSLLLSGSLCCQNFTSKRRVSIFWLDDDAIADA
jgi:hypothetical protein